MAVAFLADVLAAVFFAGDEPLEAADVVAADFLVAVLFPAVPPVALLLVTVLLVAADFVPVLLAAAFVPVVFLAAALLVDLAGVDVLAALLAALLVVALLVAVDLLAVVALVAALLVAVLVAGAFLAPLPVAALAVVVATVRVCLGSFLAPETTSLRFAPALNLGMAVFLALMRWPVRGLRTHRASRTRFSKEPKPVMATFSPLATSRVIVSITDSRAWAACLRLPS